jgi:hypothetical protein
MSRFEALSEVRNYLNSISYINNGGCGIAALVMFRWMKKNRISTKGVKFHFMERFDVNTINNNKKYLKTKSGKPQATSHIGLIIDDITVDSTGIAYREMYPFHLVTKSINILIEAINNVGSWCPFFDRNTIPTIEKDLGIDLSDVVIS